MGKYNVECGRHILTNASQNELKSLLKQNRDYQINWQQFHARCRRLPNNHVIWFKDEINRPGNWDDRKYGAWFKRRLVFLELPSRHKNTNYKVVISFIPTSWQLLPNFDNRLGFQQDQLRRVIGYGCIREGCRAGSRLLGCCGHVAGALCYLGVFAQQPALFRSAHSKRAMFSTTNNRSLNISLQKR